MKKKLIAIMLLALLLGAAACAPAQQNAGPEQEAIVTPAPEQEAVAAPTPPPEATATPEVMAGTPEPTEIPDNDTDLVQLLKLTRSDIEAKYGAAKPIVYDSIQAYMDNGEAIDGFPVEYENLKNVQVFFNADEPSSESAKPYMPKEKPADKVIGIKLASGSLPYNVKGYTAAVAAADYDKYKKEIVSFEGNYNLDVQLGTLRYVWVSKQKDMSDSWLFVCNR